MKKSILFVLGSIAFCLLGIELFYESPVIDGDDLFVEDDLGIDIPVFDLSLDSTAELSPGVKHILGLYVPYISSSIDDTCYAIDMKVHRHSNKIVDLSVKHVDKYQYEYGCYCGASRYDGHVVRLWGENINDFWATASAPIEIQADSNYLYYYYPCDDQCCWSLCIDLDRQKILPLRCYFFCGFPYPEDTLINMW